MTRKRNAQIKDPTIIKLNDELRKNTEALKLSTAAKKEGDTSVVAANHRGGDRYEYTMPPPVVLKGSSSGTGQSALYGNPF